MPAFLAGLPITPQLTLLSSNTVLNKVTGGVTTIAKAVPTLAKAVTAKNTLVASKPTGISPAIIAAATRNRSLPVLASPKKIVAKPSTRKPIAKPKKASKPAPVPKPKKPPKPKGIKPPETVKIKKEVEIVKGIDGRQINLFLQTAEGRIEPTNGFLVEVYLSGTDGTLTRVYRDDDVDVLNDDTLSEGFSSYLTLEVDR